ncbi:MAG: EamA family transporter [Syntrophomonas sp.]
MGLLFAVFAMICWGIAPIFAKIGLNNVDPLAGLVLRTMIAMGVVTGWVGISGSVEHLRTIPFNSWLLIGIEALLATIVGDLAYYYAIKNEEVSLVSIILSTSPLVTMFCAVIFLGEPVTIWRVIGAVYIVLGMILVI